MTDREVMQQALHELEGIPVYRKYGVRISNAITALRTALEQQAEPSQWRDMVVVSLVREGVNKHKARELADHFAAPPQQQAEPVAWINLLREARDNCKASIVEDGISAGRKEYRIDLEARLTAALNTPPPQQQADPVAWMDREGDLYKMPEIENWSPPHTMLYTTLPQRKWVGLTDEDINRESAHIAQQMKLAFHAGMYVAQQILKEKNSD